MPRFADRHSWLATQGPHPELAITFLYDLALEQGLRLRCSNLPSRARSSSSPPCCASSSCRCRFNSTPRFRAPAPARAPYSCSISCSLSTVFQLRSVTVEPAALSNTAGVNFEFPTPAGKSTQIASPISWSFSPCFARSAERCRQALLASQLGEPEVQERGPLLGGLWKPGPRGVARPLRSGARDHPRRGSRTARRSLSSNSRSTSPARACPPRTRGCRCRYRTPPGRARLGRRGAEQRHGHLAVPPTSTPRSRATIFTVDDLRKGVMIL